MLRTVWIYIQLTFAVSAVSQVGDQCKLNWKTEGTCQVLYNCQSAIEGLRDKQIPVLCGFNRTTPIVCCDDTNVVPIKTNRVVPIKTNLVGSMRISEEKCKQYLDFEISYEISPALGGGGVDAILMEFPHMALLGYGKNNSLEYKCGGSLISEQFVLTAAHCLSSRELGPVVAVHLGDLDTATNRDRAQPQDFTISATFPHPDYDSQSFYNDIALIKLDRPVKITGFVKPACLQSEPEFEGDYLTATGWGALYFGGEMYNKLQKLDLMNLPKEKCLPTYKPQPKLERGIDEKLQICGGNLKKTVDTCHGDSGGPLQMQIQGVPPVYRIVGVTSFGIHCNLVPGIYTRVSKYIGWIESVVWPA